LKLIFSLLAFCILIQTKGQTISLFSNQAPITKDLKKWAKKPSRKAPITSINAPLTKASIKAASV
jgi:hypothetical protein